MCTTINIHGTIIINIGIVVIVDIIQGEGKYNKMDWCKELVQSHTHTQQQQQTTPKPNPHHCSPPAATGHVLERQTGTTTTAAANFFKGSRTNLSMASDVRRKRNVTILFVDDTFTFLSSTRWDNGGDPDSDVDFDIVPCGGWEEDGNNCDSVLIVNVCGVVLLLVLSVGSVVV
jgi:hypothetical protein